MKFKHGTHVYTSDERDVGTIDRVVVDPSTEEVRELIVRKGWLFSEDKVVPIHLVASATEDRVTVVDTKEELDSLPPFEERYYVEPDGYTDDERAGLEAAADIDVEGVDSYVEPLYSYPPLGTPWWGYGTYGTVTPPIGVDVPYPERVRQNIPEGTVAVKEGARVYSSDGKHVGNIEEVFIDVVSNRATHYVISKGLLFKESKLIPTNWVKVTGEDEMNLSVATNLVENLPPYSA